MGETKHGTAHRAGWPRRVVTLAMCGLRAAPRALGSLANALRGRTPRGRGSGVLRSLAALIPGLVAFAAVVLAVFVAFSGYLYPIRPDVIETIGHPLSSDPALEKAWGGPTLLGAWAVHALIAAAVQTAALLLVRGATALQDRLLRERI